MFKYAKQVINHVYDLALGKHVQTYPEGSYLNIRPESSLMIDFNKLAIMLRDKHDILMQLSENRPRQNDHEIELQIKEILNKEYNMLPTKRKISSNNWNKLTLKRAYKQKLARKESQSCEHSIGSK